MAIVYTRVWQTFSVKDEIVNILGFERYTVSVATTQLCHISTKAGYGPIKPYLRKQETGQVCPTSHALLTPGPQNWCGAWSQ